MLARLIRVLNVSIAVVVLLFAIAMYWFAFRPLPKTSGTLRLPVSGDAIVKRDVHGVPHIKAKTWQDAIFLQGYVTAQDRMWQMDGLRRFAAGELSEVFGAATLKQDQLSRRMRLRAIAAADANRLTPEEREVMVAYARGVNAYIETHHGRYALEFSLPGHAYDPRPWQIVDSLLVGLVMFRDQTDSATLDLNRAQYFATAKDPAKMKALFPATQGAYVNPGSNAWAVSGLHTADGKPLLANDPHLAYGIPSTWYLIHLKAPGLDVSGSSLPGVPCILSGHNDRIAWGFTSLLADVMDLYKETLDPHTGRYLFAGHQEQAQLDTQVIAVRGAKPYVQQTWVTRHGPIVATEGHTNLALRWVASEGLTFPFMDLNRATDWRKFQSAIQRLWGPELNFVYADRDGNIGYQEGGRVPIRRGFDGETPVDGASGQFEWQGYIPPDQMPSAFNPPGGLVATANQSPFNVSFPYPVSGSFHDRYRIDQIKSRLQGRRGLTVSDMLAVQKDVYSAYDHFLARQVIAAAGRRSPALDDFTRNAMHLLGSWNGQMDKDEAAPLITQYLASELGRALVSLAGRPLGDADPLLPRPEIIQDLLSSRPAGWVPGNDWDGWLLQNFTAGLEAGRKRFGSPVAHWRWGSVLQWSIQHAVGKQLPFVNGYFDIGPVPMSGAGTTIKQTTATLGPSERMVVDVGNWDKSVQNLPTGESGNVASPYYKDQWPAYYVGQSVPMQFQYVDAKQTLRILPGPPSR